MLIVLAVLALLTGKVSAEASYFIGDEEFVNHTTP